MRCSLLFTFGFFPLQGLNGARTLTVDPETRGLTVSSSTSGSPELNFGSGPPGEREEIGQVRWELSGLGGPPIGPSSASGTSFQEELLFSVGPAIHRDTSVLSTVTQEGGGTIILRIFVLSPDFLNVAGTGETLFFTGFPPEIFARFVNADGQGMTLVAGSDFGPIQVNVIPEPGASFLLSCGLLVVAGRRRRRV